MGPGGGNAVQGLGVESLISFGFCCLWQGDGEFGDAVGVDDVPADTSGDAMDDAAAGEMASVETVRSIVPTAAVISGWLTPIVWLESMLLVISTSRQNKVYWA